MRFSVVTPSFKSLAWLKLCAASVADQPGPDIEVEHIVQDSCSPDGTPEWLAQQPQIKSFIEKDRGMYDAVNRGLKRAGGDILCYLNCDEQYLPGALQKVAEYFKAHPEVEVVFGDFVVVDGDCRYLFHRKVLTPTLNHTLVSHLQTFTCATFFRRSVIERGLFFDPTLRDVGDGEWMIRMLRAKIPMAAMHQFTSVFAMTGGNMSLRENAVRENAALRASAPPMVQRLKSLVVLQHRLRRAIGGVYSQKPFGFEIFTPQSPQKRAAQFVSKPRFKWRA